MKSFPTIFDNMVKNEKSSHRLRTAIGAVTAAKWVRRSAMRSGSLALQSSVLLERESQHNKNGVKNNSNDKLLESFLLAHLLAMLMNSVKLTVQDGAETYGVDGAISFDSDLTLPFDITIACFSQLPQNPPLLWNHHAPLYCILGLEMQV